MDGRKHIVKGCASIPVLSFNLALWYIYRMDVYLVSLATGAIGLGAMAFGGLSHGGHAGHGGGHGQGGHAGHAGHSPGGASGHGAQSSSAQGSHSHGGGGSRWSAVLNPRLLFSVLVGFGAAGVAATPLVEPLRFGAALAGGAAFEMFIVGPLWRFLFRFESRPAATHESAIEDEARAVTGFDTNGQGLVSVDVDGQNIQLLATLSAEERTRGVRIRRGDMVRIAEVDAGRGRCTVTLPSA